MSGLPRPAMHTTLMAPTEGKEAGEVKWTRKRKKKGEFKRGKPVRIVPPTKPLKKEK